MQRCNYNCMRRRMNCRIIPYTNSYNVHCMLRHTRCHTVEHMSWYTKRRRLFLLVLNNFPNIHSRNLYNRIRLMYPSMSRCIPNIRYSMKFPYKSRCTSNNRLLTKFLNKKTNTPNNRSFLRNCPNMWWYRSNCNPYKPFLRRCPYM